jgi:hypothetical protein
MQSEKNKINLIKRKYQFQPYNYEKEIQPCNKKYEFNPVIRKNKFNLATRKMSLPCHQEIFIFKPAIRKFQL